MLENVASESSRTERRVEAGSADMKSTPSVGAVLPGCHLTVADIEELREILESFGLDPVFVPDLSGSLDGHVQIGRAHV